MITNKELKYCGYFGCRCKYCFNKRVVKKELDNRRTVLKRDTKKEVNFNT